MRGSSVGRGRGRGVVARPAARESLSKPLIMHVSVAPGLEPSLVAELASLRITATEVPGGARVVGGVDLLQRIHLYSRIAARVTVIVGEATARDADALARCVPQMPWLRFLRPHQPVEVAVSEGWGGAGRRDAVANKIERAIRASLKRPGAQDLSLRQRPAAASMIRVVPSGDRVALVADASGDLLYKRGWRRDGGPAPIRENLAAGLLWVAGWKPSEPLVDPMCGTGTFSIEAASIALGLAPGAHRSFAFTDWPLAKGASLASEQAKLRHAAANAPAGTLIVTSDRDEDAVLAARANARRAGVGELVRPSHEPFAQVEPPARAGLVVLNPPWGERLHRGPDGAGVFEHLGVVLRRRWQGWRVLLIAPNTRLLDVTGLGGRVVCTFPSGGIKVQVMLAEL